ncbi:MAG TPA: helix-turn-helix transcriptional regulator [Xanthobacteraceae bacterium]|nr:helix-turn-helix transcriptional regulator [Xanthobacteraceae bacterium]
MTPPSAVTAAQCRAARGLLDWSQEDLATMAGVGIVTVRHIEAGKNQPRRATLDVIRRAFENNGILFVHEDETNGAGVRLLKAPPYETKSDDDRS